MMSQAQLATMIVMQKVNNDWQNIQYYGETLSLRQKADWKWWGEEWVTESRVHAKFSLIGTSHFDAQKFIEPKLQTIAGISTTLDNSPATRHD